MNSSSIIFLNGTSGAGKTRLAKELQLQLDTAFWHLSSDQFIKAQLLPPRDFEGGKFTWDSLRPKFFHTFHHCILTIAQSGNNVIVDHIIEEVSWLNQLQQLLQGLDIFFVGVHCHLAELEKRELERLQKNKALKRYVGESKEHLQTHNFCLYDLEVDTTNTSVSQNTKKIMSAWENREQTSLFFKSK